MRLMKFGGTSLSTAERLDTASRLVAEAVVHEPVVVVTSAIAGVTDLLKELVSGGAAAPTDPLEEVRRRYLRLWESVAGREHEGGTTTGMVRKGEAGTRATEGVTGPEFPFPSRLGQILDEVSELRGQVAPGRPWPPSLSDHALGMGERPSTHLLAAVLERRGISARPLEGREVIRTDGSFGAAKVEEPETRALARRTLGSLGAGVVPVVAGFTGGDSGGRHTTLGRGTSDLTASVLGAAMSARVVEIWTDVDGIFPRDPRSDPGVEPISDLSYEEARLLARNGAKVLHPHTLDPLEPTGIPLVVRNTLRPEVPGSVVSAGGAERAACVVRAGAASRGGSVPSAEGSGPIEGVILGGNGAGGGGDLPIHLILAGATGGVGTELLKQLASASPSVRRHTGVDLRIAQAFSRSVQVWDPSGLSVQEVMERLAGAKAGAAPDGRAISPGRDQLPLHPVFVDCTASPEVSSRYLEFLRAGVPVVTPNKLALSGSYSAYVELQSAACLTPAPFRYETTVGAALPILGTVRKLRMGGDRLRGVAAVLSGTLSYVFDQVSQGTPFSKAVAEARRKGFTEPHPKEDLGGADVARKLLILLREAGLALEPAALPVESLVPDQASTEEDPERFLESLEAVDPLWLDRVRAAGENRLTYLAWYDGRQAGVGVRALPPSHPLASLRAGENMVVLTTDRYPEVPLTIAGPGAGREVTASGVFTDLLAAIRDAYAGTRAAPSPHPTGPGTGPTGKRRAA